MANTLVTAAVLTMGLATLGVSAQDRQSHIGSGQTQQDVAMPSIQTGSIFKPESSKPAGNGRFHTNYVLRSTNGGRPQGTASPDETEVAGPDGTIELSETPCSLGNLYVGSPSTPCTPSFNAKGGPSAAGYGAIALVDAYDNPDAATDLANFSSHFGLEAANFKKIYANGNGSCKTPPANADWALEESLDIEWAHVFAPKAAIILVEACSNSDADLFYAEQTAFEYIVGHYPTGGQVSNSWSGAEFASQISDDLLFADHTYNSSGNYRTHITAFASAGDSGEGPGYPSTNPWVISAGGSEVLRDSGTKKVTGEACWPGSGGGISTVETWSNSYTGGNMGPWAAYQYPLYGQASRATPDLSFDADPSSGVYVLSTFNGGWYSVGGTSVSSPALASIVNRSGNQLGSGRIHPLTDDGYFMNEENTLMYSQLASTKAYESNFYDVTKGSNGSSAVAGYDLCTGLGTPRGLLGK
jgi:kumamolisin